MASTEILELRDRPSNEKFKIRDKRNCCLQQWALISSLNTSDFEVIDVVLNYGEKSPVNSTLRLKNVQSSLREFIWFSHSTVLF